MQTPLFFLFIALLIAAALVPALGLPVVRLRRKRADIRRRLREPL